MKRIMSVLAIATLGGCAQMAADVKQGVHDAPVTFWDSLKEVVLFAGQLFASLVGGWLEGLLGMFQGLFS